jgi:hypothetical protein
MLLRETYRVNKEEALGGNSLYGPTYIISLSGKDAPRASHLQIVKWLHSLLNMSETSIESLYREKEVNRWYLVLSQTARSAYKDKLENFCKVLQEENITIEIYPIEKDRVKGTIQWVPYMFRQPCLDKICKQMTGDPDTVLTKDKRRNIWFFQYRPSVKEVPHYLDLEVEGESTTKVALVTLPGRKTACLACGEDSHWESRCPKRGARQPPNQNNRYAKQGATDKEGNPPAHNTASQHPRASTGEAKLQRLEKAASEDGEWETVKRPNKHRKSTKTRTMEMTSPALRSKHALKPHKSRAKRRIDLTKHHEQEDTSPYRTALTAIAEDTAEVATLANTVGEEVGALTAAANHDGEDSSNANKQPTLTADSETVQLAHAQPGRETGLKRPFAGEESSPDTSQSATRHRGESNPPTEELPTIPNNSLQNLMGGFPPPVRPFLGLETTVALSPLPH